MPGSDPPFPPAEEANDCPCARSRRGARGGLHRVARGGLSTPRRRDGIAASAVIALVPHPATPTDVLHVSARAERGADGALCFRWELRGAVGGVCVPPLGPVGRGDRLWEHTCVEAFVAAEDAPGYVELNVSPARAWALYAFDAYRAGARPAAPALVPAIVVRRDADALAIEARVALVELSAVYAMAALRVGLAVVVEAVDGRRSYWALRHPSAQPDFHHPDGCTLRLAPPPAAAAADGRGAPT